MHTTFSLDRVADEVAALLAEQKGKKDPLTFREAMTQVVYSIHQLDGEQYRQVATILSRRSAARRAAQSQAKQRITPRRGHLTKNLQPFNPPPEKPKSGAPLEFDFVEEIDQASASRRRLQFETGARR